MDDGDDSVGSPPGVPAEPHRHARLTQGYAPTPFLRVMYRLAWWMPWLLAVALFFGRALIGLPTGWLAVVGVVMAPLLGIIWMTCQLPLRFSPFGRAHSVSLPIAVALILQWVCVLVFGLSQTDAGDGPPDPSALQLWFALAPHSVDVIEEITAAAALILELVIMVRATTESFGIGAHVEANV